MRLDRVLERRSVDLGREVADLGAGEDRRPHDQVAGEGGVEAADGVGEPPDRRDVGVEVAVQLLVAQLRERLHLESLVGILDVDREQAVDVRVVDLDALDPHLAVLAEQVDLVAEARQRAGQVGGVDVAAGAAQHVAVKEENAHSWTALPTCPPYSGVNSGRVAQGGVHYCAGS